MNKEQLDEEDIDPLKITSGSVSYTSSNLNLPYYHCGPLPTTTTTTPDNNNNPSSSITELVLLHGAAFTKEDWKSSGILDMLCDINNGEDEGNLSILALDLPVSSNGIQLANAFDACVEKQVLSGRSATFVTPSASGKALVSLGEMAANDDDGSGINNKELTRIIKAWIPVASGAVLGATDATLLSYKQANIPVFAIHGDQDSGGKKVTEKLKSLIGAKGVELVGRHPVYLDSPEEFVQEVMQFLDEESL